MKLLNLIKYSIYSPQFYAELYTKPFSFSLKYFYSLFLVLALVLTFAIAIEFVPRITAFFDRLGPALVSSYPEELVVTIEKGIVSTNAAEEPLFLELSPELKELMGGVYDELGVKNLVVIDTKNPFTPERFEEYDTAALVTRDHIAMRQSRGGMRLQSLGAVSGKEVVDRARIVSWVGKLHSIDSWIPAAAVVAIFAGLVIASTWKLFYLLFVAFLIWIIMWAKNAAYGYMKAYQIGLHSMTLALLVDAARVVFLPEIRLRFLFTALTLIVVWINFSIQKEEPVPEAIVPHGISEGAPQAHRSVFEDEA